MIEVDHGAKTQFEVVGSRFMGSCAETTLRRLSSDELRSFVHRPTCALPAGATAALRAVVEERPEDA